MNMADIKVASEKMEKISSKENNYRVNAII